MPVCWKRGNITKEPRKLFGSALPADIYTKAKKPLQSVPSAVTIKGITGLIQNKQSAVFKTKTAGNLSAVLLFKVMCYLLLLVFFAVKPPLYQTDK